MRGIVAAGLLLSAAGLSAAPVLTIGDPVFAYDTDSAGTNTGGINYPATGYPAAESPAHAIDGSSSTKYLNYSKYCAGIIVTPSAAAAAQSMVLTTANDSSERDPSSYIILGSNETITSADKSNGWSDHWTYIAQGTLSLPSGRQTVASPINFTNTKTFSSYWIVFPTVKDATGNNLMQIADIQLYTGSNGTGSAIFASGNPALCTGWNSSVAGSEFVSRVIDGNGSTKYLNFGENNSGFFVVPSVGPTNVTSFQLTTANDSEDRDPASWELHGMESDGKWSQLATGTLSLPSARGAVGSVVTFSNTKVCRAYRMTFPTVKNATSANSMQVAEAQFFGTIFPANDTDFDGMDDTWESQYGLIVGTNDGAGDLDSDGSTNLQEYQRITLPNNPDTDGDGLTDGVETNTGTWVSASNTGTNPLNKDSDGDSYWDNYEAIHGTDPNVAGSIPVITWDVTPGVAGAGDSTITGGAGTWDQNTTGNWTIDGGANNINWDNSGSRVVAIFGNVGGAVTLASPISADGVIVNTGAYTFSGDTLTLGGSTPSINVATGTTEMAQVIAGSAGFTKLGGGVLKLTGLSNTYSGTTYLNGIGKLLLAKDAGEIAIPGDIYLNSSAFNGNNSGVVLGGDEQIADAAVLTWAGLADTYFRMNGHTETVGGIVSEGRGGFVIIENRGYNDTASYANGTLIINTTGSNSYSYNGGIRNVDGGTLGGLINITKAGTGTQILSGNLSYTGTTTVNGGILQVDTNLLGSAVTVSGTGTLAGTGTIGLALNVQTGGSVSPGAGGVGTLTSTGGVTLNGGSLIGGGSLVGTVTVASGGLIANSGSVSGAVTVQSGGTIGGTGTFPSAVSVQSGGTLAPGISGVGTLTATSTVTLAGTTELEIARSGGVVTNDQLAGFASLLCGGDLVVTATGDPLENGDTVQLFAPGLNGTFGGTFASITLPTLSYGLSWETTNLLVTGEIVVVNYAATPTFSPAAGGYIGAQTVTITSEDGATIYYTVDGSEPTQFSLSGLSPVTGISIPNDSSLTIKAFASKAGQSDSPVATAVYHTASYAAWGVDGGGNWSDSLNWLNEVTPNQANAPVEFLLAQSGNATVYLDGSRTAGNLTFGNPNAVDWTISGYVGSILSLDTGATTPTITVQNNTATIAAEVAGSQGLLKSGPGTLALTGTNSYSGTTTVNGGVLSVSVLAGNGNNSGLGTGTDLVLNGGTLRYTGGSVGGGGFNRAITLGTNGGGLDAAMTGFWFTTGVISGPGALTKSGTGQLIVQANNTYDGITYLNAGEIQLRSLTALGSTVGGTVVADGARLCAGGALTGTITENLVLNGLGGNGGGALQANDGGTAVTYSGNITLATDSGFGSFAGGIAFTVTGPISGAGGLVKLNNNAVTLSGTSANTYTGVTTLGGTGKLVLAKPNGVTAIPGDIRLSSTAWNGNASGIVLAADEQIADTSVVTWTLNSQSGGAQEDSFLRLNGHAETIGGLVATGNGGKAQVENRGLNDTTTYGTGVLTINTVGTSSYSYNGGIRDMDAGTGGGAIAIIKTGTGTQVFAGNLSCTGATQINGGTLELNANAATPSITVANGGAFAGIGTASGSLAVNAGGSVSPGTGAGAQTGTLTTGTATIAGSYACQVDGTAADRLTVNGDLNATGGTLAFSVLAAPTAAEYVIASYTGTLTGSFAVTGLPSGYQVQVDSGAKQIKLVQASGFQSWATSNGLSGNPAADFDNDGLSDAVEYVLGTSATAANAGGPTGGASNGNLVFTFNRDHASLTPDVTVAVETGTTLGAWPGVYHVGVDTPSSDPGITVTDNGTYDTVTLTVPMGTDTAKFARLRVTVAP
ncbi:MAG: autotransporter-associated beta strand repeat-containing protein [Verrucomicrobia bacterium]|nr:autotransporter-associated beta strand repeat-containing protein [Verrucomicrobiota bacterium]